MNEQWINSRQKHQPIVKIPMQFYFQPVEILSKQLTKLNSPYNYRIHYLGPRWDDSSILHKKYANKEGYKFNDKEINKNNNFFSETMCQNQFYKNQVYYRAFQGMNPTINKEEQLQFNSRFQSGNLDCVVKVGQDQYDLFLRIDSNTRGHLFWFYFQITNGKPDTWVKLNICNMTKSIQLYEKGFKPFCCIKNNGQYKNWTQDPCYQITVGPKRLRYDFIYQKIKGRRLYELSFKYKFTSKEPVRFAYCVPYTYSEMLNDIKKLESLKIENLQIGSIGRSLTGVDIPYIMIGKDDENKTQQKNVLVCIGRLHPGQSNGSHVLSGLINYVCTSTQAQYIRKRVITIFIPMINPDGVILGNSRTGAIGKDLNRQFKTKNRALFPEICNLKKFCNKISQTNDIEIFLDFHGHSRKKNMFAFGPNYNITQPEYYRARVLPKFISQFTPIFRYFGCDYSIPMGKSTTARAVMLQELGIPYVYAIQASIGQYFDYQTHKVVAFGLKKWAELGMETGKALKQYFESIDQFSQYSKSKMNESEKSPSSPSKNVRIIPPLKHVSSSEKTRKIIPRQKDIKLIKVFEQIKAAEEQRKTSKKKPEQSDNQSDSQNQQDNLQGKKRQQFEGMVVECIQTQKKRQQRQSQFEQSKPQKPKIQPPKNPRRRQKQQFMKQLLKINTSSNQIDVQSNFNQSNNNNNRSKQKRVHRSEECTNRYGQKQPDNFIMTNKITRAQYQEIITQHVYFDDVLPENMAEKTKRNNLNLRMFNFSKVIDQTQSRNFATSSRKAKNRYLASLRQVNTLDSQSIQKQQNTQPIKMNNTLNKVSLDQGLKILECDQSPQKQTNSSYVSGRKMKGLYPASFYRIKYQNYQKKKKQRYVEQFRQENKIIDEDFKIIQAHRKRESLFLNIKKFDNNQ